MAAPREPAPGRPRRAADPPWPVHHDGHRRARPPGPAGPPGPRRHRSPTSRLAVVGCPEPSKSLTVETHQRRRHREYLLETAMPTMTVSGHRYDLDPQKVEAALQGVLPEPIQEHFVVINGRRWPPKQVLAL